MRVGFVARRHALNAVFLHLAAGDLREPHIAEEGNQMQAQARLVALDPTRAAMALGDDLVFALELRCGLLEGFLRQKLALAVLVAERQIPVLGKLLGERQAFLLGGNTAVTTGEIARTLPKAAVVAFIDVDLWPAPLNPIQMNWQGSLALLLTPEIGPF